MVHVHVIDNMLYCHNSIPFAHFQILNTSICIISAFVYIWISFRLIILFYYVRKLIHVSESIDECRCWRQTAAARIPMRTNYGYIWLAAAHLADWLCLIYVCSTTLGIAKTPAIKALWLFFTWNLFSFSVWMKFYAFIAWKIGQSIRKWHNHHMHRCMYL